MAKSANDSSAGAPGSPQAAHKLGRLLGAKLLISEPERLVAFHLDGVAPLAAVFPETAEQVGQVLALAAAERWGIVPWGGGHGIGAGGTPSNYQVALSLSRLEKVVDHDPENLTLSAEAGVALADANRVVAAAHQLLPLGFPGERNTLGGIVAAARCSPKRLLYGDVRDLLIAVKVALPDGNVVRYGRKVIKNVAGYDMNKLFLGSQGLLGVVVETTFKLFALPDEERYQAAGFPDALKAGQAAQALLASALLPACLFLLDGGAARVFCTRERLPDGGAPFMLLAGFEGRSVTLARQTRDVREIMAGLGGECADPLNSLAQGAGAFLRQAEDSPDAGVRLRIGTTQKELAGALAGLEDSLGAIGLQGRAVADYGSAAIHLAVSWPGEQAAEPLAGWIAARRAELESVRGSVVIESAPRALKSLCHVWGEMEGELEIMRLIKARLDPHAIMVPGRYLEAGPEA